MKKLGLCLALVGLLFGNVGAQTNDSSAVRSEIKKEVTIKKNTLAVLPIPFMDTKTQTSTEEMAKKGQKQIYDGILEYFSKEMAPLSVQDLRTTNSLLRKAGISYKDLDEIGLDELQEILGVDHLLLGSVNYISRQAQTTTSNTGVNTQSDKKTTVSNTTFQSENTIFEYKVNLEIVKDGVQIYAKNREPLFVDANAWFDAMIYLIKRSPVVKK